MHSEKITLLRVIHLEGVLDPYYFNYEPVKKEDCSELFKLYGETNDETFMKITLFQQDSALLQTTQDARAL